MYQKIYLDNFKQTLVSRVNRGKRISVYPICKQRLEQTTWIRILLLYRIENAWKKSLVFDEVFDVKKIGYSYFETGEHGFHSTTRISLSLYLMKRVK